MHCEIKEVSSVSRELSFVVPKERVNSYLSRAFQAINQKVKLNGYRPGKAPRALLERFYGEEANQKALEKLMGEVVFEALDQHAIKPITKPRVNSEKALAADNEFSFTAQIEILPEFELKQWEDLAVQLPVRPEIDDEAVTAELESLRTRSASFEPVEDRQVTQAGDYIDFVYEEHCGDHEHHDHDHKPHNRFIELGAKTFYPEKPEVEAALVGVTVGQPVEIGNMTATVEIIKRCIKPVLDDEFAKDLSDKFETLADLRADVHATLTKNRLAQLEEDKKEAAMNALIDANPLEVPEGLIMEQAQHMAANSFSRFPKDMAMQMWKMYGQSFIENAKPNAARLIKANLLVDKIAAEQGLVRDEKNAAEYFDKLISLVLERARIS
ncbi:MAG: trigger factor [Myxococcaceae bacterium]